MRVWFWGHQGSLNIIHLMRIFSISHRDLFFCGYYFTLYYTAQRHWVSWSSRGCQGNRSLALHTLKVCFDGCFLCLFSARDFQTVNHPEQALFILLRLKTSLRCFFFKRISNASGSYSTADTVTDKGHVSSYTSDECVYFPSLWSPPSIWALVTCWQNTQIVIWFNCCSKPDGATAGAWTQQSSETFLSVLQQIMKHVISFSDIALVARSCIHGTYSGAHFSTELPFSVQCDTLLKYFTGKWQ